MLFGALAGVLALSVAVELLSVLDPDPPCTHQTCSLCGVWFVVEILAGGRPQ